MIPSSIKGAVVGGVIGLLVILAIWLSRPLDHLWPLYFWPSQVVGMGTDGIIWKIELLLQFGIYAIAGVIVGLAFRIIRGQG